MKSFLAALLFQLLLCLSIWAKDSASEPLRILWVGSSSTYVHDLPLQVSDWLNHSDAFPESMPFLVGKSGTGFHEYLREEFVAQYGLNPGETLLEKIADESFNYVVIQQITYFIAGPEREEIQKATETLVDAIREAGGRPVFYEMGWRLDPINETGREICMQEAKKHRIELYSPCSTAWARVRAERPDIELHNLPDKDHPGTLGTYLNLCCFWATFTGKPPDRMPTSIDVWPLFGSFDREKAKALLRTVELDDYHAALPGWMQSISVMRRTEEIEPETARYLQRTAWAVYLETQKSLNNSVGIPGQEDKDETDLSLIQ
jgi:hypothetical protein